MPAARTFAAVAFSAVIGFSAGASATGLNLSTVTNVTPGVTNVPLDSTTFDGTLVSATALAPSDLIGEANGDLSFRQLSGGMIEYRFDFADPVLLTISNPITTNLILGPFDDIVVTAATTFTVMDPGNVDINVISNVFGSITYDGTTADDDDYSITTDTPITTLTFKFTNSASGGNGVQVNFDAVVVPEPAALAIFGLGLIGLGLARRRRA